MRSLSVTRVAVVVLVGLTTIRGAWACSGGSLWLGPIGREPAGGYPVNSRIMVLGDARPLWDGEGRPITPRPSTVTSDFVFESYFEIPVAELGAVGATAELHLSPPGSDDIAPISLHIGPPDTKSPVPPRVAFGVHRYPRAIDPSVDSCGYGEPPGNVTLWVHLEPASDAGAPVLYRIAVAAPSGTLAEEVELATTPESIPIRTTWIGDPRDLRVTVTAADTAGNEAPPVTVSPAAIRRSWGAYGRVDDDEPLWEDGEALASGEIPTLPTLVPRSIRVGASGALGLALAALLVVVARGIRAAPRVGGWVVAIGDWAVAGTVGLFATRWGLPRYADGAEIVVAVCAVASFIRTTILIRAVPAAIWTIARSSRRPIVAGEVLVALAAGAWLVGCRRVFGRVPEWVASALALPFPDRESDNPTWPILTMVGVASIALGVWVRRLSRRTPLPADLAQAPLVVGLVVGSTEVLAVLGLRWHDEADLWRCALLWCAALSATAARPRGRMAAVFAGLAAALAFLAVASYLEPYIRILQLPHG